jgi:hypothetical protein
MLITKICSKCDIEKPITEFNKANTENRGYRSECRECQHALARIYVLNHPEKKKQSSRDSWARNRGKYVSYSANKYKKLLEGKLLAIKKQNCICPGCGFNYSICPDKALLIIFECSHIHSTKCNKRKSNARGFFNLKDEFFWSCRPCNIGKQRAKCGYWVEPEQFFSTCAA